MKITGKDRIMPVLFIVCFVLLSAGTLFPVSEKFWDGRVLAKYYAFLLIVPAWAMIWVSELVRKRSWSIDPVSVAFSAFMVYIVVRTAFSPLPYPVWYPVCAGLLYFIFRSGRLKETIVNRIVPLFCCIEAIIGILQYAGALPSGARGFVTGTFDNPAGYSACLAIGIPFCLSFNRTSSSKASKRSGWVAAALLFAGLCLSGARAGILAGLAGGLVPLFMAHGNRIKRRGKRMIPVMICLAVLLGAVYFVKKDSADGRLPIWRTTAGMVGENPVIGGGNGFFRAHYMERQAAWFESHPESRFAPLADNVKYPFNEFLGVAADYGLAGIFLLLLLIASVFRRFGTNWNPGGSALLAVLILSFFSYPFRYPFVWVIAVYSLAICSRKEKPTAVVTNRFAGIPILAGVAAVAFFSIDYLSKDFRFERKWKLISRISMNGGTARVMKEYEELEKRWHGNPLFFYNYAAELHHIGRHSESNEKMGKCLQYYNDYDVQMILADNYKSMEQWDPAIGHYRMACSMCPNRFIPLREIFRIYRRNNCVDLARETARTMIDKEVKIPSVVVSAAQREAEIFLEKTNTHEE